MDFIDRVRARVRFDSAHRYGHHGEMAFPEINLVPWNTTTDKPQAGYTYKETVETEWRLLDFNGKRGGRR